MFLVIGPLGNFLYLYFISFDPLNAIYGTFGIVEGSTSNLYSVLSNTFWYGFLFFVPFSIRYLRVKLGKIQPVLSSLAPEGEMTVRSVFGRLLSARFQLVVVAVFLAVYATSVPGLLAHGEFTALSGSIYLFRSIVRSLTFGSVLGLYCGALWGLYRFGKKELKLKPFKQDRFLGVRDIGSVSFTFAAVYFVALTLFTIHAVIGGMTGDFPIVNLLFIMSLPLIGVILFLAPLVSTHERMVKAKEAESLNLMELSTRLLETQKGDEDDNFRFTKLLAIEALERKISSIPTWPFATQMLGKLTTIMLSVVAIVTARIIQIALGF